MNYNLNQIISDNRGVNTINNDMEYLDIVTEDGTPTGKKVDRNTAHSDGILHRTAHVWVVRNINGRYEIMLQKRSMNKDSFPGKYDTSSAGHMPAGSEYAESAIRELDEELGIEATSNQLHYAGMFRTQYEKEFHGRLFKDNEVTKVFVYMEPVNIEELSLQESEVEEVRWFDLDEVAEEIKTSRDRFCVPSEGLSILTQYLEGISI